MKAADDLVKEQWERDVKFKAKRNAGYVASMDLCNADSVISDRKTKSQSRIKETISDSGKNFVAQSSQIIFEGVRPRKNLAFFMIETGKGDSL